MQKTPPIITPPETPGASGLRLQSPPARSKPYHFSTLCATVENPSAKDQHGSSSVPIYQTATFKGVGGEYDYSRSGNPTRSHLEHHLAKISSAKHAFAVSSGMAALDVITRLLKSGDEVIAGDDLYGGTNRLLTYLKTHQGVTVHHVDTTTPATIHPLLKPGKTAMVLLESPTNPLLKIADLATICADIRERAPEAIIVVDNTMMSPYLQRPLEHGADIVYDSGTKYLSGHHDLMAGVVVCNRDDIAKRIAFIINAVGNALTPFDSFLLLRGIKTLAIRMERQQSTAIQVARYLSSLGFVVHYPGLEDHPGYEIHQKLASGPGAVLSFTTGDKSMSERIVGGTRLWGISVSFGAVNSLISMPCVMSHASIDPAVRAARGLPEDLIRLCVGIEHPTDLIEDLEIALVQAGAIKPSDAGHVRTNPTYNPRQHGNVLNKAIEKLADRIGKQTLEEDDNQCDWVVSAPGKAILFGEHAVVHGVQIYRSKTAIAASVDLRCYATSSARDDGKIHLTLPDLNFEHTWDIAKDLPWDAVTAVGPNEHHPSELDTKLIEAITNRALPEPRNSGDVRYRSAVIALLYIYMTIASPDYRPALNISARATLPVGAGLGSSASYSTCVATILLLVHRRISAPPHPAPARGPTSDDPVGHLHLSHAGRRALPRGFTDEVNRWAFVAEKVLHGNPSGVDNAVAVYGGALAFTKPGPGRKGGMDGIQGFKSVRFLLVNTKVPRDTKSLVARVGAKKEREPDVVNAILERIQAISDEARRALADPELPRSSLLTALEALIDENHAHLVTLGVSHPALERIREVTASRGLHTKLTGAGGGGCAVTLIPDELDDQALTDLVQALEEEGFAAYLTSVGGSGMGILSPYLDRTGGGKDVVSTDLETKPAAELGKWADELGRWLYS
ncbi:cystathionine beta-lyase [Tulasnella sp. 403]|nr:cystathionine beta-lyase [Tulasnella sp. 403]